MGESLGRYNLLRRIAAGGMAEIWKAKAVGPAGFQKTVAIKRILPHLVEETEFIQMFIEEAKLAAELVHPNVIQVFDFGQLGQNDYFIAMEYVAGPSLARLLKRVAERQGNFPAICALYVIMESAKGLGHAHSKTDEMGQPLNIVHRDVSPQNILLSYAGDVKIGDFGIAKAAGAVQRTQEGQVRGKLSYMSPEQANGRKDIDGRSDLFSLGVCLYELLTGRRLFPANLTTVEAYGRVAGFRGLDLEDLAAVPQPFRDLVGKALRAEPADRFQSGAAMEQAIAAMLGSKGIANGKQMLSSMITSLFDEERQLEMTPTNVGPPPVEAPLVVGSVSGPAPISAAPFGGTAETVKSPIIPIDVNKGAPLRPSPTPMPTPSSGLTLNPSKAVVQPRQISKVNAVVAVDEPAPPPPIAEPRGGRRMSPAMIGAMFGGGALLIVAVGLAVKLAGGGGGAAATPTATPLAQASATPGVTTPPATVTAVATSTNVAVIPTATPAPTATPVIATPQPTKAVVVAKGTGTLSVNSRPWVQVFVDGKLVKPETPLTGHKLPAGRHWVRLINAGQGFDETRPINVPADGEVTIQVDVRAKTVLIK